MIPAPRSRGPRSSRSSCSSGTVAGKGAEVAQGVVTLFGRFFLNSRTLAGFWKPGVSVEAQHLPVVDDHTERTALKWSRRESGLTLTRPPRRGLRAPTDFAFVWMSQYGEFRYHRSVLSGEQREDMQIGVSGVDIFSARWPDPVV